LIGDGTYDSDLLDRRLRRRGIELIAPHRRNRIKPASQDGRSLRRYRRRWKIERLNPWLQNFCKVACPMNASLRTILACFIWPAS